MHRPKHTTLAALLVFALALTGLLALPTRSYVARKSIVYRQRITVRAIALKGETHGSQRLNPTPVRPDQRR